MVSARLRRFNAGSVLTDNVYSIQGLHLTGQL